MLQSADIKVRATSNASQRIIAVGIVFACLYFASSIIIALLLAILLAYFLDPVVGVLERLRIPRALGALLVLLAVTSLLVGLGYLVVARADQFWADWPRYSEKLRQVNTALQRKLAVVQKQVDAISPEPEKGRPSVRVAENPSLPAWISTGVGSLYSVLLVGTFVPFLVFFMLAGKRRIWKATMELFSDVHQAQVQEGLEQVSIMLRSYVAGNALIAVILMLLSWAFFLSIHLDYPFLAGCVSGLLNLVPYLGALLACLPPFLVGMGQWSGAGPYVGIAATVLLLHIIGLNVLMPAIVGRRVHLNALSVTIALLFWGWLWGALGLVLAIPVTAAIKVVCDHVDGWEPAGRWLGA